MLIQLLLTQPLRPEIRPAGPAPTTGLREDWLSQPVGGVSAHVTLSA